MFFERSDFLDSDMLDGESMAYYEQQQWDRLEWLWGFGVRSILMLVLPFGSVVAIQGVLSLACLLE